MSATLFLIISAALLILGLPVFSALGLGTSIFVLFSGFDADIIIRRSLAGIDATSLMCIPFFILAGELMAQGGIAKRLVEMSKMAIGRFRGGLSFVTILACTFFAAVTGSNVACCMALGIILIPAMIKQGYNRTYAAAVTAAGSTLGPIIPPSISMVVYCSITNASVSKLFLLGIPAGFLLALFFCITAYIMSLKYGYKGIEFTAEEKTAQFRIRLFLDGIWALGTPIIILGGIFGGICTPTEASVLAVLYSLFIGLFVYKELTLKDLPRYFLNAAKGTTRILIIISTATAFAWVLSYIKLPQAVLAGLASATTNGTVMLLIIMAVIFVMGMFLEAGAIMLIAVPIFMPIVETMGIDLVYFGVLVALNCSLGCITPPFGVVLYTGAYVGDTPVMALSREIMPFILAFVLCIILLVFFPGLVTWII